MDVKNVEQLMKYQMMTQIMKQSLGDSNSFQLVMESLTKAMQNSNTDLKALGFDLEGLQNIGLDNETYNAMYNSIESDVTTGNAKIDEAVERASKKYHVDKSLIMSVIKQESSFNPKAVSSAGAMGLMQLMPGTARDMGVDNPFDIEQNIDGGTRYLSSMLDMYANSKELALSAYNAGPGTLKSRGVDSKEEISKLPYETKDYVSKVMKYYGKNSL